MFDLETNLEASADKASQYARLTEQAEHLLRGERDPIANAANLSALLYHSLPEVNWCGFYLFDGEELVPARLCPHRARRGSLWQRGAGEAHSRGPRRPQLPRPHRLRRALSL